MISNIEIKCDNLTLTLSPKKQVYYLPQHGFGDLKKKKKKEAPATPPKPIFLSLNIPRVRSFHLRPVLFPNGLPHRSQGETLRHRKLRGSSLPPASLSPFPQHPLPLSSLGAKFQQAEPHALPHRSGARRPPAFPPPGRGRTGEPSRSPPSRRSGSRGSQ